MLRNVMLCIVLGAALLVSAQAGRVDANGMLPNAFGADQLGHGFDAVTMEETKLPVIELTYDQGNTYVNPIYPDLKYRVPDQFAVVDHPSAKLVNYTKAYDDVYHFLEETQTTKKSHGFMGFGSKSKTTYHMARTDFEDHMKMAFTYQEVVWYEMTLLPLPPPSLHHKVQRLLDLLPATYSSDNTTDSFQAYRTFIQNVGTHYNTEVSMGGFVKGESWYHECFLGEYSLDYVQKQSGWSIFGIIGDQKGSKESEQKVDENFFLHSYSSTLLQGGNANLIDDDPAQWPAWIPTIHTNMMAVSSAIAPITDLIRDPTQKANVIAAIADYATDGAQYLTNVMNELDPKEPVTVPDWCKNPNPGMW